MTILTVTSKGQVTLRKEVLDHLGVKPGEKIAVDLLPDGKAVIGADRKSNSIENLFGFLKGKARRRFRSKRSMRSSRRLGCAVDEDYGGHERSAPRDPG